eukprot:3498646-Prymnesium_polylepis.1
MLLLGLLSVIAQHEHCDRMPLTTDLVARVTERVALMRDVAAIKADFSLVFDPAQEISVLEAAESLAKQLSLPTPQALVLTQLLADCAKHEQDAHLQTWSDEGEEGEGALSMPEPEHDLETVRELLRTLNSDIFDMWARVSSPGGEWEEVGCACARSGLSDMLISTFSTVAVSGCGNVPFLTMLGWAMLSASVPCRI